MFSNFSTKVVSVRSFQFHSREDAGRVLLCALSPAFAFTFFTFSVIELVKCVTIVRKQMSVFRYSCACVCEFI